MKKKILTWLLICLGLIVLVFGGLLLYLLSSKNEIRNYAVEQINRELTAKVEVGAIDLTLLEQFPMVSLDFNAVRVAEPGKSKKTLLQAEHLFVSFNIYDVLLKKYRIRQIVIDS